LGERKVSTTGTKEDLRSSAMNEREGEQLIVQPEGYNENPIEPQSQTQKAPFSGTCSLRERGEDKTYRSIKESPVQKHGEGGKKKEENEDDSGVESHSKTNGTGKTRGK